MAVFFDLFRERVSRYAHGVHRLGGPAGADQLGGLPGDLAAFLASYDGVELFGDAVVVHPAAEVVREDDRVWFARLGDGDELAIDGAGVIWRREGEDLWPEGTSLPRWLDGVFAAEALLYDREGEFKEGLFDEEGEDLAPKIAERHARKHHRADPKAAAPAWRLSRALSRLGRSDEAVKILAEIEGFAWASYDLGRALAEDGSPVAAEEAFARAAIEPGASDLAATAWAQAARMAHSRGDEEARRGHAAHALELSPRFAAHMREAASLRISEEARGEARELTSLGLAVAPRDLELLNLIRQLA